MSASSQPTTWQRLMKQPQAMRYLKIREAVLDGIRAYFKGVGFTEVDTPLLVRSPGTEPFLEVFETELQIGEQRRERAFLLTSPEYAMKKLVAAGIGHAFTICKSFRNQEGLSSTHNHEFTILEWYHVEADYTAVMRDFEELMAYLVQFLRVRALLSVGSETNSKSTSSKGELRLSYQGRSYDLKTPWERISVPEAFERYAGVELSLLLDEARLPEQARQLGLSQDPALTWEEAFHLIMLNRVEPQLGQASPTILYDYPVALAALAKRKASEPRLAERFEVYLAGLELGNAFSELTDADEQEARFRAELAERDRLGKTPYSLDEDYLAALRHGLPATGGIAVGVDRLVMLLADTDQIQDVIPFPISELFSAPS